MDKTLIELRCCPGGAPLQDSFQPKHKPRSPFQGFLPFFWLALAGIGGILFADWVGLPVWLWAAGAFASTLTLILAWRLPKSLTLTHQLRKWIQYERRLNWALLAGVFFLGAWRYSVIQTMMTHHDVAFYNDRGIVQVIGTVIRPPDYRDQHTNLVIQVESLHLFSDEQVPKTDQNVSGRILLQMPPGSDWEYGYRLQVTGLLQAPVEGGDFSYQLFLARKGIHSMITYSRLDWVEFDQGNPLMTFIFSLRTRAYHTLQYLFPSPESDLLAGILLGRDQGLSPELQEAFRRTGTTHIIAISGFNIAILAGLFSGISTRLLGRRWGSLVAITAVTYYSILVGGDAAVVRAAIMGSLGVMGGMFGRRQNGLNSLGLAALVMAALNPHIPWDVSFQLSLGATLGLVLYAQPLEERFIQLAMRRMSEEQAQNLVGPASEFLLFTLAAQVMTLPIMAYHFGGISWLALLANPFILPPQSLVIILGGLAMLAGMALPGLGRIMAIIALPPVSYTIHMVNWFGRLPVADIILPNFHFLWLVIFYGLLFMFTLMPRDQLNTLSALVFSFQTGLMIMAGAIIFLWRGVLTAPDGHLHLTLLDSQGTVLIQTPAGNSVLVGGGARPSALNQALGQLLPARNRQLDAVIIGSTSRDDLTGLIGVVKKFPFEMALWGVDPNTNQSTIALYSLLAQKGVPITWMESGQSLHLGDGLTLEILWTGPRGALIWLEWEQFNALIPTGKVRDAWQNPPKPPLILFLPRDLKAVDCPLEQINLWGPAVILLPVDEVDLPLIGEHDLFTLLAGYPLVKSFEHGWVRITTDGDHVWVHGGK